MAEITVRVCDVCKDRIAIGTCPICASDVCKPCTQAFSLELGMKWRGPTMEFFKENVCLNCSKKLETNAKEIITKLGTKLQPEIKEIIRLQSND